VFRGFLENRQSEFWLKNLLFFSKNYFSLYSSESTLDLSTADVCYHSLSNRTISLSKVLSFPGLCNHSLGSTISLSSDAMILYIVG